MEVTAILFHELYGSYFCVVTAILSEATKRTLTADELYRLVNEKAFAESVLTIPTALQNGEWPLLDSTLHTPLLHTPYVPLTMLEKQWLKALLLDPRILLFSPSATGLEDVVPLFTPDMFVYFDRYTDGDRYEDPGYIARFHTILAALREKRKLKISFEGRHGILNHWICVPNGLEYSPKDDKFRLLMSSATKRYSINLSRMTGCELLEQYDIHAYYVTTPRTGMLVLELMNERNALERAMLHFSHLEKETVRLENRQYRITLHYNRQDETELLIRVLSFGPMIRVVAPQSFIQQIKRRLKKQKSCEL